MLRVGFLFNHYFPHQVPHAVPYAFELSKKYRNIEVLVACSSTREMTFAKRIGSLYPGHRCTFQLLSTPWYYGCIDPVVSKWKFLRKKMVLRHNLSFFRGLDALVSPERNCMKLRTRYGITDLIMIHTRHGAGDREGGFDDKSGAFDFTLLPGRKYVDQLQRLGYLSDDRYAVIGWPKFEVVQGLKPERPRLFRNDRPIVVYNPHFDQSVSSWKPMGLDVLDFFAENRAFNLIFAPHVVLFKRSRRHRASLPRKYRRLPNIHIDTGSDASIDMTYMLGADVYLGDVSSQVYEFLLKPRPCIFLNGHQVAWQNNPYYRHWGLGRVVDSVRPGLGEALSQAFNTHPEFLESQQKAFAYTFHTAPGSTAAERGAVAIAEFLLDTRKENHLNPVCRG
ncbi:hypothetical protein [Desulfococcus multivorans]|uniref:CDP-glycerol:poly(Glycerophosphate) glycerophosphotransferase n=1 Tax=Desulfococcus multivorans DSM 2059 TaxID=1121405 RepID=S7TW85_DESML|nr:hypothetical protein [Desulfococcus multivorans]AQV02914.2 hypothetical protein B2D07_06615 [Desulfococcus multivorans]EPR41312.1 hypothetical protein dsmv_2093 [Desulfococcus multivorans DSM 2059]SJZ73108.1 hypothetical protein SAMN02745446_01503 [Desulfococcus multivorans DSM 2059]